VPPPWGEGTDAKAEEEAVMRETMVTKMMMMMRGWMLSEMWPLAAAPTSRDDTAAP
jgi:hypothetical protein